MKKIVALMMVLVICLSLCCCSDKSNVESNVDSSVNSKIEPHKSALAKAVDQLENIENKLDDSAAELANKWSTYDGAMERYIEESHVRKFTADIDEVKKLIGSNGSSDYYNAIKNYYSAVKSYHSFLCEDPIGYTGLTYTMAISEHKSKCAEARSDLSFYE